MEVACFIPICILFLLLAYSVRRFYSQKMPSIPEVYYFLPRHGFSELISLFWNAQITAQPILVLPIELIPAVHHKLGIGYQVPAREQSDDSDFPGHFAVSGVQSVDTSPDSLSAVEHESTSNLMKSEIERPQFSTNNPVHPRSTLS